MWQLPLASNLHQSINRTLPYRHSSSRCFLHGSQASPLRLSLLVHWFQRPLCLFRRLISSPATSIVNISNPTALNARSPLSQGLPHYWSKLGPWPSFFSFRTHLQLTFNFLEASGSCKRSLPYSLVSTPAGFIARLLLLVGRGVLLSAHGWP